MRLFFGLVCSLFMFCHAVYGDQKVVLITGAHSGIGLATAKAFQAQGWKVWAGFHHKTAPELVALERVRSIHLDVTQEEEIEAVVQAILQEDGKIDALINNAAIGVIGTEELVTIEEARKLFEINFFGPLRLIQAVAPAMRQQSDGHIINVSSASGVRAIPGLGVYAATKFALEGLSESLAVTLSPWNIKVSLIEPGAVNNEWVKNCVRGSRPCNEPLFQKLTLVLQNVLTKASAHGQNCDEIGALIVKVAETAEPDMRYQTSATVRETVAKKLADVTGNAMRDDQLRLLSAFLSH